MTLLFNTVKAFFKWTFRFILLFVLFIVFFVIGSMAVEGVMPDNAVSEPGLVSMTTGLLIIALADLLVIATLLLVFAILWKPGRLGRLMAGYIGVNYFIIAAAQTMGQTEKYGFVIHLSALLTMLILGLTWLVVTFRNDIQPTFKKPSLFEFGLIALALLAFWGTYAEVDGTIRPHFDLLLLLTGPDYGLTFCFTTPVFLLGLILIYPNVNQFAYRITTFSGLLYGFFNLTHWFNPATQWMGFLHLPLLIISLYASILPRMIINPRHNGISPRLNGSQT